MTTRMMHPFCCALVLKDNLNGILLLKDAEADLKETTEYKDAQAVLEAANKAIEEDADKA